MKKVLLIIVLIIIAVIIFFAIKGCEPRIKPQNNQITETAQTKEEIDYRSAFIEANTEFTCQILKDPTLAENEDKMKKLLNDSYVKYDFPTEDDTKMIEILNKYENDEEVINEIKYRVKNCPSQ